MLPQRPLTNIDLIIYAKELKIPHFRGVFMRDNLPRKIRKLECGVVNMDSSNGPGTHWTAYKKNNNNVLYFDSFGNLKPPTEILKYFNSNNPVQVLYNYKIYQNYSDINCGHLCLYFLCNKLV